MSTFRQNFGATFRAIRKSKKLNQDMVAEKSGLSVSYISDVERGAANPKLDTIDALAKGVGVTAADLFCFDARVITPKEAKGRILESVLNADEHSIMLFYQTLLNISAK